MVAEFDDESLRIEGVGLGGLSASSEPLDCRNSGSTMRMLAGVLAAHDFQSVLTGDESLQTRPMRRIIEPLERMGARVESEDGRAPLRISGRRPLLPLNYEMKVASAQVKTAILLAGLSAFGRTQITERKGRTRDHTERMLGWFGVEVETRELEGEEARVISLEGPAQPMACDINIPGDISSAAFFIAAAALLPGSNLLIKDVGLNPTRAAVLEVLRSLGASVETINEREECAEPVGDVRVMGSESLASRVAGQSNVVCGALVPQLIDELPVLAVVGTQVEGGMEIRDAAELRLKESDRISATVANLRAMGASVQEHDDGLTVGGRTELQGARLDARGDHRIAMAFAIAALIARGHSEIVGAEAVSVSFPEFFALLDGVVKR